MNVIVTTPRQPSILKRAAIVLGRLSKMRAVRARPRYVNIGEFSTHLQRDMGFLDGHAAPGSGCDARDTRMRDWTR